MLPPEECCLFLTIGRQQRERPALQGTDGAKVPLVEGEEAASRKLAHEYGDREICQAEIQVRVSPIQVQRGGVGADVEGRTLVTARRKVIAETASRSQ
jgi:hypothetical protein